MGNQISPILPGLFVGNAKSAKNEEQLNKIDITHVLSIHDNPKPIFDNRKYLCVHAYDTADQDLSPYFRECIKFIHEARLAGGSVLVHCLSGMSRSVTITIVYVMTATDHHWEDALAAVRYHRDIASPNAGFIKQLEQFQKQDVKKEREWLRETYGDSTVSEDSRLVEDMSKKFKEKQQSNDDEQQFNPSLRPTKMPPSE